MLTKSTGFLLFIGILMMPLVKSEVDYSDHKKFIVQHVNNNIYDEMVQLHIQDEKLDFWLLTRNMSIVVVPPNLQTNFQQTLNQIGAVFSTQNVESFGATDTSGGGEGEDCGEEFCSLTRTTRQVGFFRSYQRYSTIVQYMKFLARRYPSRVSYIVIGHSYEGRPIGGLHISLGRSSRGRRLAYIQGGAHAREWITETTVLYFATQLAVNINSYRSVLRNIDVIVVPCLNPDGYEYSHSSDRYWRKNRRFTPGHSCRGVDINRNFGVQWNRAGASQNLCSEVYSGRSPFSEVETQAVKRFLERYRGRTKLMLDVHSFGSFIFYPFGFSRRATAPTKRVLQAVANRAALSIRKYRGTSYKIGTSAEILYEASGGLDDYAYGGIGIPLSYTVELPGKGFEVNPREIIPIGKETFNGFLEFLRYASVI